jgi:hypothetical protein
MVAIAASVGIARAETPSSKAPAPAAKTARLVYEREVPECPDESTLRNEVLARLGYDPFTQNSPRTMTASIERTRSGLRAHIVFHDPGSKGGGSRTLESTKNDCSELASAMVLAITIAIDPSSLTRPPPTMPREARIS